MLSNHSRENIDYIMAIMPIRFRCKRHIFMDVAINMMHTNFNLEYLRVAMLLGVPVQILGLVSYFLVRVFTRLE